MSKKRLFFKTCLIKIKTKTHTRHLTYIKNHIIKYWIFIPKKYTLTTSNLSQRGILMSTEISEESKNKEPAVPNLKFNSPAEKALKKSIHLVEFIGLIVIAIATTIAGGHAVLIMFENGTVTLGDLLLLFLYLEVLAMVAIYLESGKLPIRLPLYIAIIALARYLILDMKELNEWEIIAVAITIILITISTLILRYGSLKYPYKQRRKLSGSKD